MQKLGHGECSALGVFFRSGINYSPNESIGYATERVQRLQKEFLPVHWSRVMVDENDTKMTKLLTQRKGNFWRLQTEIIMVFLKLKHCEMPDEGEFAENAWAKSGEINLLQELSKTLNYAKKLH